MKKGSRSEPDLARVHDPGGMPARGRRAIRSAWTIEVVLWSLLLVAASSAVALRPVGSEVAAWWPASGVAVWGVLRRRSTRGRAAAGLMTVVVTAAANLVAGHGLALAVPFGVANAAEALVVAQALSPTPTRAFRLRALDQYGRVVLACLAGSFVLAVLAATTVALATSSSPWPVMVSALPAHLSGSLVVLGIVLAPPRDRLQRTSAGIVVLTVGLLAGGAALFCLTRGQPVGFVPLAGMVLAAFVLSPRATAWVALGLALTATMATARGSGPFVTAPALDPARVAAMVQLFIVCASALATPLSLAIRDRRVALEHEREALVDQIEFGRMRGTLLSTVTHELRTPLTVILGYSEVLCQRLDAAGMPDLRDQADAVHRNGVRLVRLVDDLIAANGVHEQSVGGEDAIVLADLLERSARAALPDCEIVSVIAPEARDGLVSGDPAQLGRVVEELVSNARGASDGRAPVVLSLSRSPEDPARACVQVTNTGKPLSAAERRHVFDAFFRTEASRREGRPGVGLGLTLARHIVRAHGGDLDVTSGPGSTTVTATLPWLHPVGTEA